MSEFSLIQQYFTRATPSAILGVGDDAALVRVNAGMELAISTDMLVCGTHFFADADPYLLGHKTLAVNISDMAAMGAQPRWATLSLSLPEENSSWLKAFSDGFFALADAFGVELIGGDTTRGPLNLCVTIMGEVPQGQALRRDGAQPGDEIWVSGKLGDAALALAHLQGRMQLRETDFKAVESALHQPQPRVALGLALRGIAHSAIDLSDGLLSDLGHILERSNVGAELHLQTIPHSAVLSNYMNQTLGQHCVLAGGDDYELCFTAPASNHARIDHISQELNFPLSCIGNIVSGNACRVLQADGTELKLERGGYDHFA